MTAEEAIKWFEMFQDNLIMKADSTEKTANALKASKMAIEALEKQTHLERDLYDEIFMKGYYPTDKPEGLSKYHLFVPYKVVEHFIKWQKK